MAHALATPSSVRDPLRVRPCGPCGLGGEGAGGFHRSRWSPLQPSKWDAHKKVAEGKQDCHFGHRALQEYALRDRC